MQAPSQTAVTAAGGAPDPNRTKVVAGFSASVADKGYAATTIADIVRHARVSKRTFYEHFEDKEACFLAAYVALTDEVLRAISVAGAARPEVPWRERIRAAASAYFGALEAQPALTRTFLLEIHAGGPRALALRREVHQRFADLLRGLVHAARKKEPLLPPLSPAMATAIVGGINELVLVALERGRGRKLHELMGTVEELVSAVLAPGRSG
jgi:AcrR family transcriptional regulator